MARKSNNTTAKKQYDVDYVRSAARSRWPEIITTLGNVSRDVCNGEHQPCPKCGGHDRFRMIDADAGAVLCNQCFDKKNGDGFAAVQWLRDCKFGEAMKLIADHLGIEPTENLSTNGKAKSDPAEHLEFLPWRDKVYDCGTTYGPATIWCALHKPGITPAAMLAAHCRLAKYKEQYTVFAFPHWGPKLMEAEPIGWTIYNVTGGLLPKFNKTTKTTDWIKVKVTRGSQAGLIGPVERIADASTIWKPEGPTDLLALLSLDLPADVTAVSNANGAGEKPAAWMVELFANKAVRVIHDADEPGQTGAVRWCEAIAFHASECHNVTLPYSVSKDHGRDLRDWINETTMEI